MQKRTQSCFTVQIRGSVALNRKNQKARSAVKHPQGLALYTGLLRVFFVAVLPVRQHKVRDP